MLLPLWVLFSTISAASLPSLQGVNNQLLFPYGSTNGTGIITLPNATTLSPNPSADLNAVRAQCNGRVYGSDLNVASCRSAFDKIIPDDIEYSFDDAACSFEQYLIAPNTVAHATYRDMKNAAQALLEKCTASSPAKGGVASNIGGDNRLAIVMRSNHYPNIVCHQAPNPPLPVVKRRQFLKACTSVVNSMPVTQGTQTFGPSSVPGVAFKLPLGLADINHRYIVQVFDNGSSDTTSWYNLWEVVGAIVEICATAGYTGESRGSGTQGNLGVKLEYGLLTNE